MGKPLNVVAKELINKAHQARKDTVSPMKREYSIFLRVSEIVKHGSLHIRAVRTKLFI